GGGPAAGVAAGIRNDDDLELEALGAVDREQADCARPLLLRDGFALRRAERLLVADVAHEALDVPAAQLLVRARHTHELAKIRIAARAVTPSEHGEVVVVLAH